MVMPSCQHAEEQQQHLLVPDFAGNQVVFGTAWYGVQVCGWHSEPSLGTAALLFLAIQPMSSNQIHYQTNHLGHAEALWIRLNHRLQFSSFEASHNMMWCYSSERKNHHWKDETTLTAVGNRMLLQEKFNCEQNSKKLLSKDFSI